MKYGIAVGLMLLLVALAPIAHAQAPTESPGVTPDSFLYGLDVALDRISFLLTFDQAAKSRKGLEIASERLLEVRAMAEENKVQAMERAQSEHDDALTRVETSLRALERDDSSVELEEEVEIERRLLEHRKKVEEVEGEIEVKIQVKGGITPEQRELINSVLSRLENRTGEVEIEIENKKDRTKVKIRERTGKSEDEVEEEVEEVERRRGLAELKEERALEAIEDAREEISEAREKLGNVSSTLLAEAGDHLARAEAAFEAGDFGRAFGQATSAANIAKSAREEHEEREEEEEEEEELEIEVEIEGNVSKVKVEIGDAKSKFRLDTTDREAIIAEIAARTGLSADEVRSVVKFEEEEEEEHEEIEEEREERREEARELSIEVVIRNGTARVEIELAGRETRFEIATTNRGEIIDAIAQRTNLTAAEIEGAIKWKAELGEQERTRERIREREETEVERREEENRTEVEEREESREERRG